MQICDRKIWQKNLAELIVMENLQNKKKEATNHLGK